MSNFCINLTLLWQWIMITKLYASAFYLNILQNTVILGNLGCCEFFFPSNDYLSAPLKTALPRISTNILGNMSMLITRFRLYARNDKAISALTEIFLFVKK